MFAEALAGIDAYDGITFDQRLLDRLAVEAAPFRLRGLEAATPTFKTYVSDELEPCGRRRFPAFSITGPPADGLLALQRNDSRLSALGSR